MAPPVVAPMPQALDLAGSYTFRFDAVDPATGNTVASVVVSDASIFGEALSSLATFESPFGPFMLVAGPDA